MVLVEDNCVFGVGPFVCVFSDLGLPVHAHGDAYSPSTSYADKYACSEFDAIPVRESERWI